MGNRVTSKGQVTIPKEIRDELGIRPGDEISFARDDGGFRAEKTVVEDPFDKYRGHLKKLAGVDVDELIEEMRGR
jgi:antitoxin PrlF